MNKLKLQLLETYQEITNLEKEIEKSKGVETELVYMTRLTLSLRLDLLLITISEFKSNN